MATHNVYQFYAELADYEPKIWRRFEINGEKTMAELAYTVMIMFEMQASHLFSINDHMYDTLFEAVQTRYGRNRAKQIANRAWVKNVKYEIFSEYTDLAENEHIVEADLHRLDGVAREYGVEYLVMEYDFGDGWEVVLRLGSVEKKEISLTTLPQVLEGEGYGIIEDAGGVSGLADVAEVLADNQHENYQTITEWLGSTTLNLAAFDKDDMNVRLKQLLRFYKNAYEKRIEPTEKELAILLRQDKGKGYRGY